MLYINNPFCFCRLRKLRKCKCQPFGPPGNPLYTPVRVLVAQGNDSVSPGISRRVTTPMVAWSRIPLSQRPLRDLCSFAFGVVRVIINLSHLGLMNE